MPQIWSRKPNLPPQWLKLQLLSIPQAPLALRGFNLFFAIKNNWRSAPHWADRQLQGVVISVQEFVSWVCLKVIDWEKTNTEHPKKNLFFFGWRNFSCSLGGSDATDTHKTRHKTTSKGRFSSSPSHLHGHQPSKHTIYIYMCVRVSFQLQTSNLLLK